MKLTQLGPNKTEISNDIVDVLFSYNTPVAAHMNGHWYKTDKFWSVTTSKHINQWIQSDKVELRTQAFFDSLLGCQS